MIDLESRWVSVAALVRQALDHGGPVVALETAVATHGLPSPQNIQALERMQAAILEAGATPAILLVHHGILSVGASIADVEIASADSYCRKAGARDLGHAIASDGPAGLTVSASLVAARISGIRVFATGGIGGVHIGADETGDISADLVELSRSLVVTVCSGAKSILDIPRTLEMLETLGVPVLGYRCTEFPAFVVRSSGLPIAASESVDNIASIAGIQWSLGQSAGLVIGNPLPGDQAIDPTLWDSWMRGALAAAREKGIRGKEVTPFLLDTIARLSDGVTVVANLELLERNAWLAAQISVALAR